MILSPIRLVRCALIKRQLDQRLAERKQARVNGEIPVRGYVRRRAV